MAPVKLLPRSAGDRFRPDPTHGRANPLFLRLLYPPADQSRRAAVVLLGSTVRIRRRQVRLARAAPSPESHAATLCFLSRTSMTGAKYAALSLHCFLCSWGATSECYASLLHPPGAPGAPTPSPPPCWWPQLASSRRKPRLSSAKEFQKRSECEDSFDYALVVFFTDAFFFQAGSYER